LRQVAAGVEAAHDEGILHRDLKPANIFIMQKRKKNGSMPAGDGFIKVGDFGLAKIVSQAVTDISANSGPASRGIIGTPEYMAPEQMQPGAPLDARADVYALGTIAYHMLGGRPPFTGDLTQLITQKVLDKPPPLSSLRSDIQPEVERVVMHALEKEAEMRPASVADWLDEFERAVGEKSEEEEDAESRVVILAPSGAEVYIDDERYGSIGSSGRIILSSVPPGRHKLRVARSGERDDERVIEVRPGASEQIIQAQLRPFTGSGSPASPSRGGSSGIGSGQPASLPGVVMCAQCGSRFAAGVRFCGRCGGTVFHQVSPGGQGAIDHGASVIAHGSGAGQQSSTVCPRCGVNYPAGTKFCGRCGISIGMGVPAARPVQAAGVMCTSCSTNYPAGTKFCGRCGSVIKSS
jgi:serine/threonine protein kinase